MPGQIERPDARCGRVAASGEQPCLYGDHDRGHRRCRSCRGLSPLLDGAGCAPPEDVGGIPGFELFLDAIADPDHEQHDELMRWHGGPFDPADIDEDAIRVGIAKLARRRALGKAAFAKSRR